MIAKTLKNENLWHLTDGELVKAARNGLEENFEELVRRYQRAIVGYVYRILNDYDAALDVGQEIFIKVYNSLDKYSPEYKFSTWIYRIAHNAAIDAIRRRSGREISLEMDLDDGELFEIPLESGSPSPETEHERSEWRGQIEAVVAELPTNYRDLIVLRHAQDLSYEEIAEITELPLGTVKNRLFRAREMMRKLLIERGISGV